MTCKPFTFVEKTLNAVRTPDGLTMVQKPTVRVGDEEFVADLVARVNGPGNWPHLVVVEFHDCPYPTPGSGRRARLLAEANVPVVRQYHPDVVRPDATEHLHRRLREAIADGSGRIPMPVSVN